jgi:hypothetical protein
MEELRENLQKIRFANTNIDHRHFIPELIYSPLSPNRPSNFP